MPGKVPGAVIRERAKRVACIAESLSRRFRDSQVGTVHRALTLEDGSLAVTGNYLKLRIPPGIARNEWVAYHELRPVVGRRRGPTDHPNRRKLPGERSLAFDDQLTAGGADVASAALPHRDDQPTLGQNPRKSIDDLVGWPLEGDARRRIERDQIDFRLHARQQPGKLRAHPPANRSHRRAARIRR